MVYAFLSKDYWTLSFDKIWFMTTIGSIEYGMERLSAT